MVGHVVVVEDAPAIAEVLEGFLRHAGYEVRSAPDGAGALELIHAAVPDAVVTDVLMPQLSGTDLVRRMRAAEPSRHTPVVIFTGLPADNEDIADALAFPLVRLVQKGRPFGLVVTTIEELRREVSTQALHPLHS